MNTEMKGRTEKSGSVLLKLRKPIIWLFNAIYVVLYEYSKYVLLIIVLIVCTDVVSRSVFSKSIMWVQETSLLLIVWMTFLSMAIGSEKNLHIGIDLFYNKYPERVKKIVNLINKVVVVVIGIFLGIYGWRLSMSTWRSTLAVTKLPAGMLYLMIPVGGWSMAFFMILDILGLKKYKKTDYNEEPVEIKDLAEVMEKMTAHQTSTETTEKL